MKLTVVTAVLNAIKSGNRERLIRCVRSVAALKTEHEHLVYDGGSTDGTLELLRKLEEKIGVENRCTEDVLRSDCCAREGTRTTGGGESGALGDRALPNRLRVVSEPDTGIYNALNKGVRDARGEWFYVLGCDDYLIHPEALDDLLARDDRTVDMYVAAVMIEANGAIFRQYPGCQRNLLWSMPYCHQSVVMKTRDVKRFGGFDESCRIIGDWSLIIQCHLAALHIRYGGSPFALYFVGGASAQGGNTLPEALPFYRKHFGFTETECDFFLRYVTFPLRITLPLLVHRDSYVRQSACYVLWRWVRAVFMRFRPNRVRGAA